MKQVVEEVALVLKTGASNFSTIIQKIDTEQPPFAVLVVPSLDV